MVITKLELNWLLFAQMVNSVETISSEAIPVRFPVVLLNDTPLGRDCGAISHVRTSPPKALGGSKTSVWLTIRERDDWGYVRYISESSTSSRPSHRPSPSESVGKSNGSRPSFRQAASSASLQPSPSSSSSVSSGSPSPSVSSSSAEMVITKLELYSLLFAQMVNDVWLNCKSGVPEINPVELLNDRPLGNDCEISHDVIVPPEVMAGRETLLRFTMRLRFVAP